MTTRDLEANSGTYRDANAPVDARVENLLAQMTIAEKVAQLGCVWSTSLVEDSAFSEGLAELQMPDGIGHITRIGASTGLRPGESAAFMNAIQRFCVERTRLGIPVIVHEEGVAGFTARDATVFPQAIGLAATWNPELIGEMADVIRTQMLAVGARQVLSPVLDIARDPRWGRLEETYGEDPYLTGRLGVAYVRAMQGSSLREGVACTPKHFLGYGVSDGGLNWGPVHLGARELREVFAAPFAAVICEAGVASMMNSYSSVDGLPCGGSKAILTDLLRGELGFDGVVVADYFTVDCLVSHHHVVDEPADAARRALEAGLDIELPMLSAYAHLVQLVDEGIVESAVLDQAVRRALTLKFRLGLFESPYVDESAADAVFDTPAQRAVARRAAQQSLVVVTNDGVLPLAPDIRSIAVIGPAADDRRLLQGDYHYPAHLEILGAGGLLPESGGAFEPAAYYTPHVTPLAGIRARAGETVDLIHVPGCEILGDDASGVPDAARAAERADVAIVFVGGRSGLLQECTVGEARDASSLGLTGRQEDLVREVIATGTPTVVVLVSGRAHALPELKDAAGALIYAWCPGEEGGTAMADVLFGDVDATGRLPVSIPRGAGHVPVHYNQRAGGGASQFYTDYADSPVAPLFPFGHGLSYTSFEYEDLRLASDAGTTKDRLDVQVVVRNTGTRAGTDVVQLYLHDECAQVARPIRQLAGFARVDLDPGQQKTVRFSVDATQLAYYDDNMNLIVEPGTLRVFVGGLEASLEIGGDMRAITAGDIQPTTVSVGA